MHIDVNTKFDVGQEVYIIQKARSKEPCAACNGEGHIIIDGNKFSCDKCFGTGRLHGKRKIYQLAGKDTITNIKVYNYLLNTGGHHNESKTVVKYGFADRNDYTDQKLFATQEEAQARCKELNKEELQKWTKSDMRRELLYRINYRQGRKQKYGRPEYWIIKNQIRD